MGATEGTLESVKAGPGEVAETATECDVDGGGAGWLSPTAGLTGESFAVVVDGLLKSRFGTGPGAGDSAEVADGKLLEPKSWVKTGSGTVAVFGFVSKEGSGAGVVLGFASKEGSRPCSKLPLRGGEAGMAWRSAEFIRFNSSACVSPKL